MEIIVLIIVFPSGSRLQEMKVKQMKSGKAVLGTLKTWLNLASGRKKKKKGN